jgi:O-antigen/teichoic acid export membrane protein
VATGATPKAKIAANRKEAKEREKNAGKDRGVIASNIAQIRYTSHMSIARKLAVNTVIQLIGKVVSTLGGVVIISLMTRRLGAEGFGAYSTANAFLQIFALIMDVGINVTFPALLGEYSHDETFQKRMFSAIFTLRLVMSVVILLLVAPLVAFAWPFPWEIKLAVIALSFSFVFPNIQQIFTGVQQQRLQMTTPSIAENIGRGINILGLLIAPFFGWGLIAQCWIITVSTVVIFTMNAWNVRKHLPIAWNWDPEIWKMVLKRSWPVGLSIGLNLIYYKADTLVLQHFRPATEVGWYGAAYREGAGLIHQFAEGQASIQHELFLEIRRGRYCN